MVCVQGKNEIQMCLLEQYGEDSIEPIMQRGSSLLQLVLWGFDLSLCHCRTVTRCKIHTTTVFIGTPGGQVEKDPPRTQVILRSKGWCSPDCRCISVNKAG